MGEKIVCIFPLIAEVTRPLFEMRWRYGSGGIGDGIGNGRTQHNARPYVRPAAHSHIDTYATLLYISMLHTDLVRFRIQQRRSWPGHSSSLFFSIFFFFLVECNTCSGCLPVCARPDAARSLCVLFFYPHLCCYCCCCVCRWFMYDLQIYNVMLSPVHTGSSPGGPLASFHCYIQIIRGGKKLTPRKKDMKSGEKKTAHTHTQWPIQIVVRSPPPASCILYNALYVRQLYYIIRWLWW